jgi:hypothetical protein
MKNSKLQWAAVMLIGLILLWVNLIGPFSRDVSFFGGAIAIALMLVAGGSLLGGKTEDISPEQEYIQRVNFAQQAGSMNSLSAEDVHFICAMFQKGRQDKLPRWHAVTILDNGDCPALKELRAQFGNDATG